MKANSAKQLNRDETDSFSSTTVAALLFLAAKFPYRQFNSAELCILSGIGRTAMSQIKNSPDTPFSLGKCTLQRLDAWLPKRSRNQSLPKLCARLSVVGLRLFDPGNLRQPTTCRLRSRKRSIETPFDSCCDGSMGRCADFRL